MECNSLRYTRHAFERMFQREISPESVARIIRKGKIISDYPNDQPFPSVLLLGFHEGRPVHVVVARDATEGDCHVVTVYCPDPVLWDETFENRRMS